MPQQQEEDRFPARSCSRWRGPCRLLVHAERGAARLSRATPRVAEPRGYSKRLRFGPCGSQAQAEDSGGVPLGSSDSPSCRWTKRTPSFLAFHPLETCCGLLVPHRVAEMGGVLAEAPEVLVDPCRPEEG